MSSGFLRVLTSSIVKKQVVAVTGLMMVGFVVSHLAGNFILFLGPEAFNGYAEKLAAVGPLLWAARFGLIGALPTHICFTVLLTLENRAARGSRYAVNDDFGSTTFAKKTMIYTGALVLFFVFFHLSDFTFGDKVGEASVVPGANGGESLGLFGLVWNGFVRIPRSFFYILAVWCVGLHLTHGIQSVCQTIGFNDDRYSPLIVRASVAAGVLVALGFSSIPLYVIVRHYTVGVGV
ncbi:MAG: succinate dehydrogenase cytochrome b subunit [bacterium]|nr:succinate dehydrogenase cytochrome b subunit [bacterium]